MKNSVALLLILSLLLTLSTGCSTATRFHTKPEGAHLFVNGDYIGETPVVFDDRRSLPTRMHIQIRKEGYKELDFYLDKSADYLGMLISVFYGIGIFWSSSLDNDYHFDLGSLKLSDKK